MSAGLRRPGGAPPGGRRGRGLTVLKVGGSVLEKNGAGDAVLDRVAALWRSGERLLIVHGGGSELSRWLDRLGIATRFENGQRVTTPETLPVALMVLGGLINRRLVEGLVRRGCPAVAVTGADGAGTRAEPAGGGALGAVGTIAAVNAPFYRGLMSARRLPVVASLGWHPLHGWLNINADLMAAALAAGLRAARLLLMTDTAGVLGADGAVIPRLTLEDLHRLIAGGAASDGMIPKLHACRAALVARVPEVLIVGPGGGGADGGTRVVHGAPAGGA